MESINQEQPMSYLFIINPIAGVGGRRDFLQMIASACRAKGVKYRILFTRAPGDARKIIKKRMEKFDVFVAVGGDGTMNEVASALAGTQRTMGLIPAGSGNALGRELGLSMKPEMALQQLLHGKVTRIDTGVVNGRRFMNVCGLGFDDHIARCFAKSVSRGPIPYFKAVIREFFSYKAGIYTVEVDGHPQTHTAFVMTLANTSQYGNNAYIAPAASVQDGLLDFIALRPFGLFGALSLGIRLFNRSIDKSSKCTAFKAASVRITGANLNFHVDGEPIENSDPLEVSIDPLSLRIIIP
ncbi:MAG: diacylglycerol kinase family lipid kinase [Marinilabiliales bacterium]|nr:diacylglycerol kinase family lipid kinase [Marinilabiliales bacterium]